MEKKFTLKKEDVGEMKELSPYGLAILIAQRWLDEKEEISFEVVGDCLIIKPKPFFTTTLIKVCMAIACTYNMNFFINEYGEGQMYY